MYMFLAVSEKFRPERELELSDGGSSLHQLNWSLCGSIALKKQARILAHSFESAVLIHEIRVFHKIDL